MPAWVFLPRIPGCTLWCSLELPPSSEIKICLQMSVKAVELKPGIIFPRGPRPMALNGELHLLPAEVPLLITLLFKCNASCVNTNLFLPQSWMLGLTGAIISHKPRDKPLLTPDLLCAWQTKESLTSPADINQLKRSPFLFLLKLYMQIGSRLGPLSTGEEKSVLLAWMLVLGGETIK